MNVRNNEVDLLRTAVLANCVFAGLSGIILLFGSNRLSGLFGLHVPTILLGAGALVLVYAGALLLNARRATSSQHRPAVRGISVLRYSSAASRRGCV